MLGNKQALWKIKTFVESEIKTCKTDFEEFRFLTSMRWAATCAEISAAISDLLTYPLI